MQFLFPTFLFALLTIAIPIIIHLFSFRRYKTVYFSNVDFLKDIKKESQKKSRLKQLLILLARILTIVFLVFAFAQPYIPLNKETKKQQNQLVAIYVDNSFSMNALSEQGQLLEVAKNKALEICLSYPSGSKFRLFTNDLKVKHQHILNREQFIQQLSEIQPTPKTVSLSLIYNRFAMQNVNLDENTDKNLFFISDFQRNLTDIDNFTDNQTFSYFLPLSPNQVSNLYIDSCWVEVPAHRLNQEENLFVLIKNSSNQDFQNLPLKLYLNDSIKSITNFSIDAQKEITANLKYTNNSSGPQLGKVEITDYPFTHDNEWFISYFVKPKLKALAIFNDTPGSVEGLGYISALFEKDDYIQLDRMNMNSVQISKLADYNTIFLINPDKVSSGFVNELKKVTETGVSLVLFPSIDTNYDFYTTFSSTFGTAPVIETDTTTQEISGIEFDSPFYKDVFKKKEENAVLPKITGHIKFREITRSSEKPLLWFQNGDKALSNQTAGDGNIWLFSFPLSAKNESFARDILFVPTMYNIVLNSVEKQQISYFVGKNNFFNIAKNEIISIDSEIEILNLKNNEKYIPIKTITNHTTRIEFGDLLTTSGHYLVQSNNTTLASLAFNYNRKESDLRYFSATGLNEKIETSDLSNALVIENINADFSEIYDELSNGKQLWKWCILIALFFILSEVLITRFMR